ncbi:hypothetical protein SAY86_020976 [Trapa natans]|uniref:Uncharacterized protein n=1 Tax=Trapa natans TaxID=22666 RepID=A0AAN7M8Z3_TRANT|nr:hypothetical protein SAY86_020976 [Trapa natans]
MRMVSPKSSGLEVSTQIGNPVRSLAPSCAFHIFWALSRAKSFLVKTTHKKLQLLFHTLLTKKNRDKNKLYFGSYRFHYNWCSSSSSSHVQPFPAPILDGFSTSHIYYYDPTWNSMISVEPVADSTGEPTQLSKYLEWLDEKGNDKEPKNGPADLEGSSDEIDKLADVFIAKCHRMFILEKQESYRRFQEMLAL